MAKITDPDYAYKKQFLYFTDGAIFEIKTNCELILQDIEKKLFPFISETNDIANRDICVTICSHQENNIDVESETLKYGYDIVIDASLYEHLSSKGKRYDKNENEYTIYIAKTRTCLLFDKKASTIKIYNSDHNHLSTETIRLLKSLVSLQCEKEGSLMLHSSAIVVKDNQTILFFGDSRNGKTTILLEVLTKFDGEMLSCDTSIIKLNDNNIIVRGWPSNFSVSVGTMHDYKVLHKFITDDNRNISYEEAWKIYPKEVLDTKEVLRNMNGKIIPEAHVNSVICLNFNPEINTQIYSLEDADSIRNWIKKVYLGSKDILYPNWHKFWEINDQQIDENIEIFIKNLNKKSIPIYQMDWAPGPETLLRRVALLDPAYKNIKTIRHAV